jgi:hypothetical protein
VVGATTIYPLDIHIINDADDSLGCYLAIGAQTDNWKGALIEVSLDGGESFFNSFQDDTTAVAGVLTSALSDHPQPYPDDENICTVTLLNPNDELESASQTQMQNGANLAIIGNELVQFGDAEEGETEGNWTLSYFFRGRKGTATTAHAVGERFVVLDRNFIMFLPMQLSYVGRSITVRATSINGTAADVTTTTFTYTGQSQVEYPVAYLEARRAGSTANLSWQGVGKIGAGASVAMGLYFAGYRVTLSDGTTTQAFTTQNQSYSADISAFSGSITATVVALNSLTGAGPGVSVVF